MSAEKETHFSQSEWIAGVLLALLPVVSYLSQYLLSVEAGTEAFLFQHHTVNILDWIFVPFNLIVVRVIDWRRGAVIYVVAALSVVLNVTAHAFWQYHLPKGGHMINSAHVVLPGGWVHLTFSTLEMTLLGAFFFAKRQSTRYHLPATVLAISYFVAAGVSGYIMNSGFMITDVIMVALGLFFVLIYPTMVRDGAAVE